MDFDLERFWDRILVQSNGCWVWFGPKTLNGYGMFRLGKISAMRVHRFAYETNKGKIPIGLQIDHLCRNRGCCNPDHMEAVTTKENVLRGNGITAQNARKTHCKNGHEFTKENTGITKSGRNCRVCNREVAKKYYWRNKR
ncbi:MAG: HNH endonuclease signature motif containing protein [Nitrososphaerales archaeon]